MGRWVEWFVATRTSFGIVTVFVTRAAAVLFATAGGVGATGLLLVLVLVLSGGLDVGGGLGLLGLVGLGGLGGWGLMGVRLRVGLGVVVGLGEGGGWRWFGCWIHEGGGG